jgi:hypothetical protein
MWNGSEYELDLLGIKFAGTEGYQNIKCIGSCEEEMESKVISKSCRGVVVKEIVKGTGKGTLKITAHINWAIYTEFYGMSLDSLIEGVKAYGQNSVHKTFSATAHVTDEDGAEKYKAYPNCIVKTGVVRKIENGAEEVAQLELEISVNPDEFGNGLYEATADELADETVKTKWMTAFTPELVQITA